MGEAASTGLARGRALLCDCAKKIVVPQHEVSEAEAEREMERFDGAVAAVEQALQILKEKVRGTLGDGEAEIFDVQMLLAKDSSLRAAVRKLCVGERMNVEAALEEAIRRLATVFSRMEDAYLRERVADLREVGRRLLEQLLATGGSTNLDHVRDSVLITEELFSSTMAQLEGRGVRGLIVEGGGLTAHATILARALCIPLLVHVPEATRRISPGDRIIVDALAGRVFINPGVRIVEKYDQVEANLQAHESALKDLVNVPAATTDGTAVTLSANIAQTADAAAAARVKADGAGLYRTEFTFFVQDGFPTEDEQYQFYRATAELLQPNRTVIRVLDIGSDKPLPYFPLPREDNPALGCRGTRLLLAHRSVFRVQLRAILRVSATYPVSILLPMITGLEETRAARSLIDEVKAELAGESASFDSGIAVGAMIETPSAALLAGRLAGEVDFFSVGTNDLVQYLLAADRLGNATDSAYDPLHPAVLQTLASLAAVAGENGKSISLCGEMAGDPMYTALLLGLGFRQFSVNPGRLLEIKHAIRSIHISEAKGLARAALAADTAAGIRARVQDDWNRRRPVSPPDLPVAAS